MAYKNKKNFVFNNVDSDELSIINVNVDTGMAQEPFLAESTINEIRIKGKTKPYFMKKEYQPLLLNLSFAFVETWDEELIREVARVFDVDYYKPLYFEDEDDIIYYCMPIESSTLIHNSLQQGYVEMSFRCNDKYTYSRLKTKEFDNDFDNIKISNKGDVVIYPEIIVTKNNSSGTIKITNETVDNQLLEFEGIPAYEEIYIDCENEVINNLTSSDLYRYNNHNNVFLQMKRGANKLKAEGINKLQFRYRFKTLQS